MILCAALLTLVALAACKSNSEKPSVSDSTVADSSNLYTWINTRDTMIQIPTTDIIKSNFSGLFQVKLGGKHGFVDSTMMVVIPCVYDDMLDFCDKLCGVLVGDKWGFIDTEGKMVMSQSTTGCQVSMRAKRLWCTMGTHCICGRTENI